METGKILIWCPEMDMESSGKCGSCVEKDAKYISSHPASTCTKPAQDFAYNLKAVKIIQLFRPLPRKKLKGPIEGRLETASP